MAAERTVLDALGETARHSIRMLERGLSQYHAYVRIVPQVRVLREAAAEMAGKAHPVQHQLKRGLYAPVIEALARPLSALGT